MPSTLTRLLLVCAIACVALLGGCARPDRPGVASVPSVLRVRTTLQYPDLRRPWLKKPPVSREGLGTLLEGGILLVTADMVDHATNIQLETPDRATRCQASVVALDLESNLALIRPDSDGILKGLKPLSLEPILPAGTTLHILQLEPNGSSALSGAEITTAAVSPYPSGAAYLLYRATTTIPQRDGSFVVPALHDGGLAGLVTRYEPRTQAAEIIPSPLINRLVSESRRGDFHGLARAGITWAPIRGEVLREWLGLPASSGGVGLVFLDPNGPAAKAGLRKGDVVVSLDGRAIDSEGNYDHPVLGKTSFGNIVSLEHSPGDSLTVGFLRPDGSGKGQAVSESCSMTVDGKDPHSEISPSLLSKDPPNYLFFGGLLMQELSRPYLREWGNNWGADAPQNLVALDVFQSEDPEQGRHYVILSGLLPSEQTLGSEALTQRLIERINGRRILSLEDVIEARKHPLNGYHRIDLEGDPGPIFLDAATLDAEQARLMGEYGLPSSPAPGDGK